MSPEAWAVVDLGFGDAGKGSITDWLVRQRGAALVVRFNGGAQAGHNVVTDEGVHHTFAQVGAGHFAGALTLLGPDFLLHPLGLEVEIEHLAPKGPDPWPRLFVDRRARLISPYHQAAGRLREVLRGENAHGTCGVGVGECVGDSLAHPEDILRAGDLDEGPRVRRALGRQRERLRAELAGLGASAETLAPFDDPGLIERVVERWGALAGRLQRLEPEGVAATVEGARRVVFEGAQGVLLDQDWGFHPHTTWSDTTFAGALAMAGGRPLTRLGVLRAYACRHGAGPFPTEGSATIPEPHNEEGGWQGRFRTGVLDGVLLRYALEVCGGVDALALTHLDRAPGAVCVRYAEGGPLAPDGRRLLPGAREDLDHREALGRWLRGARPVLEEREVLSFVQEFAPVAITSHGPAPRHKAWRAAPSV